MNVDAFPPVRSMETSGSGCGDTCCEEIILQTDTVGRCVARPLLLSGPGEAVCHACPAAPLRRRGSASPCLAPSLPPATAPAAAFKKLRKVALSPGSALSALHGLEEDLKTRAALERLRRSRAGLAHL